MSGSYLSYSKGFIKLDDLIGLSFIFQRKKLILIVGIVMIPIIGMIIVMKMLGKMMIMFR